ncbi:MAG: class I adenylate-forming enzyme family protein [Pseudomonadota bacterium]|nr:class I adenylate-forming enzyme family protein [Pseudomonadota bacterium]
MAYDPVPPAALDLDRRAAAWQTIRASRPVPVTKSRSLARLAADLRALAAGLDNGQEILVPAGPGGIVAAMLAGFAPDARVTGIAGGDLLTLASLDYWLPEHGLPANLAFRPASDGDAVASIPEAGPVDAIPAPRPADRLLFEADRWPGVDWHMPGLSDTARGVAYWGERGLDLSGIAERMDLPTPAILDGAGELVAAGLAITAPVPGGVARWHGHASRGHAYPDPAEWTLPGMWAMSSRAFRDLPLIVEPDRPDLSYGDCDAAMRRTAAWLAGNGLGKGDLVVVWTGQCAEFLVTTWACWHLGIAVLPAPVVSGPRDVEKLSTMSGARAVLVRPTTDVSALSGPVLVVPAVDPADRSDPPDLPDVSIHPDDPAFVLPTSGTTRDSRLAVHAHRSAISAGPVLARSINATGIDCITAPMGVSDMGGLRNCMFHTVWSGSAWQIMPDLEPGHVFRVARTLATNRATVLVSYPLLLGLLADLADQGQVTLPTSLRVVYTGGTTVETAERRRIAKAFGTEVIVGFGMTELSPAVHIRTNADVDEGDGVGRVFDCLTSIRDKDGATLPDGQDGVLWLLSERMMSGYMTPDGLDRGTIRGGWLRNGDWMRREPDGFHWHGGRDDPWIKLRTGLKVHLATVGDALKAHPGVREVEVIACRDDRKAEGMAVFVVARDPSVTADSLRRHIRATLGHDLVPAHLEMIDAMPRNARDKISLVDLYKRIPQPWQAR